MHDDLLVNVSRWQFALTAAFHMTFPAVTVGLVDRHVRSLAEI